MKDEGPQRANYSSFEEWAAYRREWCVKQNKTDTIYPFYGDYLFGVPIPLKKGGPQFKRLSPKENVTKPFKEVGPA